MPKMEMLVQTVAPAGYLVDDTEEGTAVQPGDVVDVAEEATAQLWARRKIARALSEDEITDLAEPKAKRR